MSKSYDSLAVPRAALPTSAMLAEDYAGLRRLPGSSGTSCPRPSHFPWAPDRLPTCKITFNSSSSSKVSGAKYRFQIMYH